MGILRRFDSDEGGASAVEYIVALILCCMVVIGINKLFGETLRSKFEMGANEIAEMDSPDKGAQGDGAEGKSGASSSGASGKSGGSGGAGASASKGSDSEGAGGGGGAGDKSGSMTVVDKGKTTRNPDDPGGYVQGFEEEKRAGFNPILLFILLGLGGLLFFVMYKGNKG